MNGLGLKRVADGVRRRGHHAWASRFGTMPVATFAGSPYEVGLEHGRRFRSAVLESVSASRRRLTPLSDAGRAAVAARLWGAVETLRDALPLIAEELEGIAKGASLPAEEIFLLNLAPAVLGETVLGCTTVAFRETDGGPVLAKNCDLGYYRPRSAFLKRAHYAGRAPVLLQTYYGTAWSPGGMNAAGLCVGGSSVNVVTEGPGTVRGSLAPLLAQQLLLECGEAEAAARRVAAWPADGSQGIAWLFLDAAGGIAVVEQGAGRTERAAAEGNVAWTTNTFASSALAPLVDRRRGAAERIANHADARQRTLDRLVPTRRVGLEELIRLLGHHGRRDGAGVSLCRHGGRRDAGGVTTCGCMWRPRAQSAWITAGNPCGGRYHRYPIANEPGSGGKA